VTIFIISFKRALTIAYMEEIQVILVICRSYVPKICWVYKRISKIANAPNGHYEQWRKSSKWESRVKMAQARETACTWLLIAH
jgi:hypothetical protein